MKKLILIAAVFTASISYAQTLGYNDVGVLFTEEQITGTARFNALSGAFGALGGDLSAIGINPAGAAVFLKSEASLSVDFIGRDTQADYYGNRTYSNSDYVNFAQAGGVFLFRNNQRSNSGWGKIAFAFDYTKANDYENFWFAEGNSEYPTWVEDPNDENKYYYYSMGQYLENYSVGRNNKYSFTIASQYSDNLYLGASFLSYSVDYFQRAIIEEYNDDNMGNYLDASMFQELSTYGYGYSFNLGLIYKPINSVRFGFAYQSPVWYNLGEGFMEYDIELYLSNVDQYYYEYSGLNRYYYNLRTPSRYNGSFAYIFGKIGLLSIDYTYKNYSNIQLSGGNFSEENQGFQANLEGVSEVRVGTEWRIENVSLRGGYHFRQSPYRNALSSDDVTGFSAGIGYNFGPVKLDVSYLQSKRTSAYDFYPQYNEIAPVELDNKGSKFTVSLVFNI